MWKSSPALKVKDSVLSNVVRVLLALFLSHLRKPSRISSNFVSPIRVHISRRRTSRTYFLIIMNLPLETYSISFLPYWRGEIGEAMVSCIDGSCSADSTGAGGVVSGGTRVDQ